MSNGMIKSCDAKCVGLSGTIALFVLLGSANWAQGQRYGTVQLPTYQTVSMSTSLWVPDRGSVYAGGNSSSRFHHNYGARSGGVGGSGVYVSAYIHDLEAMDAAVIAEGRRQRLARGDSLPEVQSKNIPRQTWRRPDARLSVVREKTRAAREAKHKRALSDYQSARRLMAKGKLGAARIMLKNSLSRASGPLRTKVSEQLASLDESSRPIR